MSKLLKGGTIVIIVAILAGIINLWYNTYLLGQVYATGGPMIIILGGFAPVFAIGVAIYLIRLVAKFQPSDLDL